MPTRYQTLQHLSQAKPFGTNSEGVTLEEFRTTDPGRTTYKHLVAAKNYDELERKFWQMVEHSESKKLTVEYAADLPANEFGRDSYEKEEEWYEDHPWNLNKLYLKRNSLLQFWKDKYISGITKSWIYVGMLYSSFCWHYEDIMMYSVNYMHEGEGKIWYAIPAKDREKFERLAKSKLAILFDDDPNLLHNINVMINPTYLEANGVEVFRTLQKPGEFILTFPEAYHQGVSVGFNVAEAVNIAIPSWMEYGLRAMDVYMTTREKVPVFPLEWMLIENVRHAARLQLDRPYLIKLRNFYRVWLQKELTERSLVASYFYDKEWYNNEVLRILENRDEVEEDAFECFYWINLCYASFIKCLHWSKNYWIGHELLWNWSQDRIKVVHRYSNEELKQFLENLELRIDQMAL